MNRTPVILLGLNETGLYAGQSLGRYKIPVTGFDHSIDSPGFFSRYITPIRGANPYFEPEKLLEQLLEHAGNTPARIVLIASTENYLDFLASYRKELSEKYSFIIPEQKIIESILDKAGQFSMASKCGIKVPAWSRITSEDDFRNFVWSHYWNHLILKAVDQAAWKAKIPKKAYITNTHEELNTAAGFLLGSGIHFIIQEIIDGDCTNNFEYNSLMVDGKIIESFVVQKIRQYPPGYGAACCIKSVNNNTVEELGSRFVRENRIEGFSNTEFKVNPLDNEYYFIETNSRIWSQIRLPEYCGKNFLMKYYNRLADEPVAYKTVISGKEIKWTDIFSDTVLWWRYLRKTGLNFRKWICSLSGTRDFGLLNIRDLRPFLHELSGIGIFKRKRI